MVRKSQVALHVRVKLNDKFNPKSIAEEYLVKSDVIYIAQEHVFNDSVGDYVLLSSTAPLFGSGSAYLTEIDLEFPINQ